MIETAALVDALRAHWIRDEALIARKAAADAIAIAIAIAIGNQTTPVEDERTSLFSLVN